METNRCVLSTVATDALVLKHQAISNHSADEIFTALDKFIPKYIYSEQYKKIKLFLKKKDPFV